MKTDQPQASGEALRQIAARKLTGEAKRMHRLRHSTPVAEQFFEWVDHKPEQHRLLPSNPLPRSRPAHESAARVCRCS